MTMTSREHVSRASFLFDTFFSPVFRDFPPSKRTADGFRGAIALVGKNAPIKILNFPINSRSGRRRSESDISTRRFSVPLLPPPPTPPETHAFGFATSSPFPDRFPYNKRPLPCPFRPPPIRRARAITLSPFARYTSSLA